MTVYWTLTYYSGKLKCAASFVLNWVESEVFTVDINKSDTQLTTYENVWCLTRETTIFML
jgi:hypothetical protein